MKRFAWVLCAMLIPAASARADLQVWTVCETRRILREDLPQRSADVRLAAARDEWESFQVLLRCDSPVKVTNLQVTDLKGPEGGVIGLADMRLYRQHQLHLTEGTYRNSNFKSGWYPDPLIPFLPPFTHEPVGGGRYSAVPFDLPSDQTHGFWVDVHIPARARAGLYTGTCRITTADTKKEFPVALTVWDFTLPRIATLHTAFGSPNARLRAYYRARAKQGTEPEPRDWAAVDAQCAQLLSEHRINASPAPGSIAPVAHADGSYLIPQAQVDAFRKFVDTYHVNAFETSNPRQIFKDPEADLPRLRAWLAAWDRAAKELNRPQVMFYTYLLDEPNDEAAYRTVQKWGRAIRSCQSVVKVMVVEQTWTQNEAWGDLYGAVDIWCPLFCLHKQESAAQRQALGEIVWTYTALCQGKEPSPWWHIDYPLLNYRVPAWIAWRYRMRGLLYWGGMSYWAQVEDPWTDPKTYRPKSGRSQLIYNGEGTMVYPARAAGYDGIVPSLRLKALRDSIEDYEYLAILERAGMSPEAEKTVLPLAESFFQWKHDPAAYKQARAKLAEMIVKARKGQ